MKLVKVSPRKKQILSRFLKKVDKVNGPIVYGLGRCWLWVTCNSNSYGSFCYKGISELAHRASWKLHNGEIPEGLWVLHKCDNPSCVNPKHLKLGTPKDNSEDMVNKGRQAKGNRHGSKTHPESRPRGDRHRSKTKPENWSRGERHSRALKGNMARGDKHGLRLHPESVRRGSQVTTSKLTESDVRNIRLRWEQTPKYWGFIRDLSKEFNISHSVIHNVVHFKTWKHVK